jgi:hypothetical protein
MSARQDALKTLQRIAEYAEDELTRGTARRLLRTPYSESET